MRPGISFRSHLVLVPLVAVVLAGSTRAEEPPLPDSRMGLPTAPLLLLSRPDVRSDLGLSPEQTAAAAREVKALHARAAELKGKKTGEIVPARRAIDDAQQRWLTDSLTPEQRDRLSQIELQWEGPAALLRRRAIADELGLNADQLKALSEAVAHREAERAKGKVSPGDEAPLAERTLAILNADQRDHWLAMLGHHCAFQFQASRTPPPTRR